MGHPEGNSREVFVVLGAVAATHKTIVDRYLPCGGPIAIEKDSSGVPL